MVDVCKNHPNNEAKRKCYHCKASICTDCQINKFHHIFCSVKCCVLFVLSKSVSLFLKYLNKTWIAIQRFWNGLKKQPAFLIVFIVLFVGLLISLLLSFFSYRQIHSLQQKLNEISSEITVTDTVRSVEEIARHIDTLKVFEPPSNAMIIYNRIDIEGATEENRVVTLSTDGKLLEAALVKAGKFQFKDVLIKPGQNHFVVRSINENGSSVILEEIEFKYGTPTPSFLAADFTRGDLDEKKVAITFDGDYLDNITSEIMDILDQENIKCTMFLTGRYMRRYSDHILRMIESGHEVGNHTWTHPHLTTFEINRQHQTRKGITREIVQNELLKTAELFYQITGKRMKPYWRAPFGEHNAEIRKWAAEVGFRQIGWTVGKDWENGMDTLDWVADTSASYYYSADAIADKVLSFSGKNSHGANGAIILMHLGTLRKGDYPHLKLPFVIKEMKKMGYEFVTISELL